MRPFRGRSFDRQKTRAWIDRWISVIRPENVPSWEVARKLGFRPSRGTLRAGMARVVWSIERPDVHSVTSIRSITTASTGRSCAPV
jgi:hypothetical protein